MKDKAVKTPRLWKRSLLKRRRCRGRARSSRGAGVIIGDTCQGGKGDSRCDDRGRRKERSGVFCCEGDSSINMSYHR
jgi:hypothetical protein